jgi:hypothetical protein
MTGQISGSQLFLRYAWPCAEEKFISGEIREENFKRLNQALKEESKDIAFLLTICFPKAVETLRGYARAHNLETWSFEAVSEYWRYNHGHTGNCTVVKGEVWEVGRVCKIWNGENTLNALNLYGLDLQIDDVVFLHKGFVVEKE